MEDPWITHERQNEEKWRNYARADEKIIRALLH